jgi:hypothetical protein
MNMPAQALRPVMLLDDKNSGPMEGSTAVSSGPVPYERFLQTLRERQQVFRSLSLLKSIRSDWDQAGVDTPLSQLNRTVSASTGRVAPFLDVDQMIPHGRYVTLSATFSPIQEWEGYVRSVGKGHFVADLIDLTAGGTKVSQQAEIPLEELSESDAAKLIPGSIFRWAIGYQRTRAGTKMRTSQIVFRDLPRWTKRDLLEAKAEAEELAQFLKTGGAGEEQAL